MLPQTWLPQCVRTSKDTEFIGRGALLTEDMQILVISKFRSCKRAVTTGLANIPPSLSLPCDCLLGMSILMFLLCFFFCLLVLCAVCLGLHFLFCLRTVFKVSSFYCGSLLLALFSITSSPTHCRPCASGIVTTCRYTPVAILPLNGQLTHSILNNSHRYKSLYTIYGQ